MQSKSLILAVVFGLMTSSIWAGDSASTPAGGPGSSPAVVSPGTPSNPGSANGLTLKLEHLRHAMHELRRAGERGDFAGMRHAEHQLREAWRELPPGLRQALEQNHPGLAQAMNALGSGSQLKGGNASSGVTLGTPGSSGQNSTANTSGQTTSKQVNWSKDGGSYTRDEKWTGPNGKTSEDKTTWTKSGGTVTRDDVRTGPNGKTSEDKTTWTKSGNTMTRDNTRTGPNGKSSERKDTWTHSGSTASRQQTAPAGHKGPSAQHSAPHEHSAAMNHPHPHHDSLAHDHH